MIQKLNLLHYLSADTYKKICVKLNLDASVAKGNVAIFNDEKISKIELYNIDYKELGLIPEAACTETKHPSKRKTLFSELCTCNEK